MSEAISQREMRNSSSEVLRRVEAGEELTITNHGRPVARLVPIRPSVLDELIADGGARTALSDQPWAELPPAAPSTATGDELIADVRGYERDY